LHQAPIFRGFFIEENPVLIQAISLSYWRIISMFRHITRLLSIITIIFLLGFVAVFIILNTRLLTPVATLLIKHWLLPNSQIEKITYTAPNHFKLDNIALENGSMIKSIDAWPSIYPTQLTQWEFDALLLNGLTVPSQAFQQLPFRQWKTHQLSLNNATFELAQWKIEQADIQWFDPQWESNQLLPQGQFLAHMKSLTWNEQHKINNVLFNGEIGSKTRYIDALSFEWHNAQIEVQALQQNDKWILNEVTIEGLSIQNDALSPEFLTQITQWQRNIDHIERLDLWRGQIQWDDVTLNNLELSLTNLFPNKSLWWQQDNAFISLKADGIENQGVLWIEPNIKLTLNQNAINIEDMNVGLSGGDIYLSASFEPRSAMIHELDIIAVKHSIEQKQPQYPKLMDYIRQLSTLQVEKLHISNGQLIQIDRMPYWQVSGVNFELLNADIIHNQQWGLWQGSLSASFNSMSYDKVLATQAIVEMNSDGHIWRMPRLFVPLTIGYVAAKGEWQFGENGKPWNIDIEADSFPLKLAKYWPMPLGVKGLLDMQLTANGLSGDETILRHTLTGSVDASIRNGAFELPLGNATIYQPFSIDKWQLTAQKGAITSTKAKVKGKGFYGILNGEKDLSLEQDDAKGFSLSFSDNGHWRSIDVFNPAPNE
jgi:hypothetical protein